ncbi:MAG TPA: hypothetical protein VFI83_05265 [Gaiella sp.]|nr:hypothetical protein [Gaiella sp.]
MLQLDRPGAVCTVAVSLVAAVAALLPATARADDPLPSVATVVPLADTTPVATDAIVSSTPELAPLVEQVSGADATAAAVPVAAEAPAAVPEPELEATPAAEPAAAPSPPESAVNPVSTSDTTAAAGDIATDTPVAAPVPAEQPTTGAPGKADTPPTITANVNVSVRIDSPGDNGAVTQLNLPGGSASGGGTAAPPDRVTQAPATEPTTTTGVTQNPVETSTGEWYWNWDCLGSTSGGTVSPSLPEGVSFPTSWTWNWNCGDNSSKYQNETLGRYQQINTNISIRISSPGNDGTVSQVNVGAGISIPLPVPVHGAPFPPSPVNMPPSLETAPGGASGSRPVPAATSLLDTTDITAALDPGVASDPSAEPVSATPFAAPAGGTSMQTPRLGQAGGFSPFRIPLAPVVRFAPAGTPAVDAARRASSPADSVIPNAPTQPPEATPRPRAPHAPMRTPVISVSGVSASAAAGGGGSSGSGLPLLLALPFVAALLDLARRVALEHAALPTGHRRRAPDRPG